jgi:urease accessory protein
MHHCIRIAAAISLVAAPGVALAHPGHAEIAGFSQGFAHPFGGLDHVLAMIAVGLYAALVGGRALWALPAAFLAAMATGGTLGAAGIGMPYVEVAIALSVVVLGLAVASRASLPTFAAVSLVGLFAIFHGHAHGAEMVLEAGGAAYAAGFLLATALLHGAGLAAGLLSARSAPRLASLAGGAMALAGLALLTMAG